jgi:hypothetical protein
VELVCVSNMCAYDVFNGILSVVELLIVIASKQGHPIIGTADHMYNRPKKLRKPNLHKG